MSLRIERCENIIIFRIPGEEDSFMADMLNTGQNTVSSPDKRTTVTVFNTEQEAIEAFKSMSDVVKSFNSN